LRLAPGRDQAQRELSQAQLAARRCDPKLSALRERGRVKLEEPAARAARHLHLKGPKGAVLRFAKDDLNLAAERCVTLKREPIALLRDEGVRRQPPDDLSARSKLTERKEGRPPKLVHAAREHRRRVAPARAERLRRLFCGRRRQR